MKHNLRPSADLTTEGSLPYERQRHELLVFGGSHQCAWLYSDCFLLSRHAAEVLGTAA